MVADFAPDRDSLDRLFHALADTTRRDIVTRAFAGEHSVSGLARLYPMSIAAVQKHVAVLERAGLVTRHRRGREQIVRAEREALHRAHAALDELEAVWRGRIDRAVVLLTERDEGDPR
ncbi:MAG: metalloregulator ArsR/SmtB family transcription factor [Gaiellales bacterium]